jgi:hypothetical protein
LPKRLRQFDPKNSLSAFGIPLVRQPLVLAGHLQETVAGLLVGFVLSPTSELSREIAVVRPALNLCRT